MVNLKDINVTINSYTLDGEIIVPSAVLTSTPQEEVLDLTKTPNFTLKINDTYSYMNIKDTVMVELSTDSYNYSSYMNVINTTNGTVTLQYVDGLTAEDVSDDSSDDSSDEPTPEMKITFTTSQGTYQVWNNLTSGGETVMYDLASDVMGNSADVVIHGTWKYYIDDVEQDSNEYSIQSYGNMPFGDDGLRVSSTDNDGNVHSATGDIGYWGAEYFVTLDSNVTINYQMATTLDKYLDVECSLSSNSKSMALPQGNNNNLQTYVYAAVYLVDPNTVVGAGTDWEHYYTQVVVTQHTLDMIGGESLGGWGWWGTKKYDDYLVVSDSSSVYALDENGNELGNFTEDVDRVGIWRFDQLGGMQATIFDVHGMKLVVGNDEVYTKTFDLATPYIRVMRNGSQDNSGTFYGTVDKNANETVWSDYLIYPVYDDMYGGIWNASNGSDFLGQYNNGGTFVGQYLSGDPHGYQFMNNLGAFALDPWMFEKQDPVEVLIEWRRSDPESLAEYNEDTVNQYPYKVLYSHTYNFSLQVPE